MWQALQPYLTAIVLIGGAVAVIYKWIRPIIFLKDMVEENKAEIGRLKKHETRDLETLRNLQEMNKAQCAAMLCIINHMIDGNHVDRMQETRDSIQEMLAKM